MSDSIEKSTLVWIGGLLLGTMTTTATVVHLLHEQYITPLKLMESSQKIDNLAEQIRKQPELLNTANELKEKLDQARAKLARIEHKDLFIKGDIYPATVDYVELGRPIDEVYKSYDKEDIEESSDEPDRARVQITLKNSVFESIGYTYDTNTKEILIIRFSLGYEDELGQDFLLNAITRSLGDPEKSPIKRQYRWSKPDSPNAYLLYDRHYLIMRVGFSPAVWREPGQ